MTIGPDNMIYFNLGAPFNIGIPPAVGTRDLNFATIARMTPDGSNVSTFATGRWLSLSHLQLFSTVLLRKLWCHNCVAHVVGQLHL